MVTMNYFYTYRPTGQTAIQELAEAVAETESRLDQLAAENVPEDDTRMRMAIARARILTREAEDILA